MAGRELEPERVVHGYILLRPYSTICYMNALDALLLGIIEGISEFLPISSTGHLILASRFLGLPETEFLKSFEIAIQLGAILAVVALYWQKLLANRNLMLKILIAFIPTAIIGLLLHSIIKTYLLGNVSVVLWSLLLGGIFLIVFEWWYARHGRSGDTAVSAGVNTRQALSLGLFQSIAIIPGVSRSASTIVGGLLLGLNRNTIVEFSFLLAIPTMLAATALDLLKSYDSFASADFLNLGIGFVTAFVVALFSIKWLLKYIQHHSFTAFGVYRILIALIFWMAWY